MIAHPLAVEEGHLLLYGAEDAGVAGVQSDDEVSAVVVFLHQLALLVEVHVGAASHHGSRLVAFCQLLGHQTAGIQDEVGPFEHPPPPDGDQVRVARTGSHYLDKTLTPYIIARALAPTYLRTSSNISRTLAPTYLCTLDNRYRHRKARPFLLRHDERSAAAAQDCRCLADARSAHMLLHRCAGMRHLHAAQLLGREEPDVTSPVAQQPDEGLVGLHVDGAVLTCAGWRQSLLFHPLLHQTEDVLIVGGMVGQSEAYRCHTWHEPHAAHPLGHLVATGRHHDEQTVTVGRRLFQALHQRDMLRQGLSQIAAPLVVGFKEQCRRATVDEVEDAGVHVVGHLAVPSVFLLQGVQGPQSCQVALRRDNGLGPYRCRHPLRQLVGSSHMTREHCDGAPSQGVDAHHGGVAVLIFDIGRYGAHADAHCPYEHEGIEVVPTGTYLMARQRRGIECMADFVGYCPTGLIYCYDCCLHGRNFFFLA